MIRTKDSSTGEAELVPAPLTGVPEAVYEATRSLLHVNATSEAVGVLAHAVRELGGEVVPDNTAPEGAGLVEVWLAKGHSFHVRAREGTQARRQIERYLPLLVEDARRILAISGAEGRLAWRAGIDPLTGLPNRLSMSRLLSRLTEGDLIIVINMDGLPEIMAGRGLEFSDELLRTFSLTLRQSARATDHCGRMDGGEFLVVLRNAGSASAERLLSRLRDVWGRARPAPITFSAGIAAVSEEGWGPAMRAAGQALYRAKQLGPDHWESATESDYQASAAEAHRSPSPILTR